MATARKGGERKMNSGARFWIKLTDEFLNSRTIKRMEKQQDGHSMVLLLIHLLSDTKQTGGVFVDDLGDEWAVLDAETIHDEHPSFTVDFINAALKRFQDMGLLISRDDGYLAFADYEAMTNTKNAAKQQRYRDRLKARGNNENSNDVTNDVNNDVGNNVTENVTHS